MCFSAPEKSARYCGSCRKTVSGLDHHCTWLNTCVGRRNYVPFICLVFIGAAQSVLQTAVGVISLTVWINGDLPAARCVVENITWRLWPLWLRWNIETSRLRVPILSSFPNYFLNFFLIISSLSPLGHGIVAPYPPHLSYRNLFLVSGNNIILYYLLLDSYWAWQYVEPVLIDMIIIVVITVVII